jgi:hypothetical protein
LNWRRSREIWEQPGTLDDELQKEQPGIEYFLTIQLTVRFLCFLITNAEVSTEIVHVHTSSIMGYTVDTVNTRMRRICFVRNTTRSKKHTDVRHCSTLTRTIPLAARLPFLKKSYTKQDTA